MKREATTRQRIAVRLVSGTQRLGGQEDRSCDRLRPLTLVPDPRLDRGITQRCGVRRPRSCERRRTAPSSTALRPPLTAIETCAPAVFWYKSRRIRLGPVFDAVIANHNAARRPTSWVNRRRDRVVLGG